MMNPFHVGDFVVCIDAPPGAPDIVKGQRYKVGVVYSDFVVLEGSKRGNWRCTRFELAQPPLESQEYEEAMAGQAILENIERGK